MRHLSGISVNVIRDQDIKRLLTEGLIARRCFPWTHSDDILALSQIPLIGVADLPFPRAASSDFHPGFLFIAIEGNEPQLPTATIIHNTAVNKRPARHWTFKVVLRFMATSVVAFKFLCPNINTLRSVGQRNSHFLVTCKAVLSLLIIGSRWHPYKTNTPSCYFRHRV